MGILFFIYFFINGKCFVCILYNIILDTQTKMHFTVQTFVFLQVTIKHSYSLLKKANTN